MKNVRTVSMIILDVAETSLVILIPAKLKKAILIIVPANIISNSWYRKIQIDGKLFKKFQLFLPMQETKSHPLL